MYKTLIFTLIVIIGMTSASKVLNIQSHNIQHKQLNFGENNLPILCKECLNVANESINVLLQLILDTGILSSCQKLCRAVANKTGSLTLGLICDVACAAYCEMAKLCPINDHGDAKITQFSLLPTTGRKGTTFTIDFTYVSINGTGTGELNIDISCPDRMPAGATFLTEIKKPGTYTEKIDIKAQLDPRCDPFKEPCEEWFPGIYNVTVRLCNGECGSKHPHSAIYDTAKTSFVLTK
ncbi:hypothetical protein I4U23_016544 [Adineta vaga]|nr:hypothetical protein I4U23_016544 [Adineta vaga]